MLFHLGYQYDVNKQAQVVVCSKAHPRVKALFSQCGGLVPPPLNDMVLLAHILNGQTKNGQTKDVAIKTLNPLVERESISMLQVKGA